MSLKTKENGNVLVVYLVGRLDVHLASEVESELEELVKKHAEKNVLLNLSDVAYMSSSGLRIFVSLMRRLEETKRTLKLCNLSPAVYKVFEVVELMDMFNIFKSEDEALAAG